MNPAIRHLARQRIQTLFTLAQEVIQEDPDLAQRYVYIARKIAMATKTRLPEEYRRQVCRHCKSFILPGVNCRIRVKPRREPHIVITCLKCKGETRIPMNKKRGKSRR